MLSTPIRILAVEDSAGDFELLGYTLRQVRGIHFELIQAASVAEGVSAMSASGFDVVMLDLNLPDSHGLETVERALKASGTMPIIVFTGVEDEALGVEAVRMGAQDYMVKGDSNGWAMWRAINYAVERKQAAERLRQLNETLEQRVAERTAVARQRTQQLQIAAADLAQAEHRERHRLAMNLHDNLQQLLAGLKMRLSVAQGRADDAALRQTLAKMDELVNESLSATRQLVMELSPPILQQGDFKAAMDWLVEWMRDKHDLQVSLNIEEGVDVPYKEMRAFLLQSVRELLFNVVKHSGVKAARLDIKLHDDYLWLSVMDAGVGFDMHIPLSVKDAGFGLMNIRDRIELLGGCMDTQSRMGEGTRVTIIVPQCLPEHVARVLTPGKDGQLNLSTR